MWAMKRKIVDDLGLSEVFDAAIQVVPEGHLLDYLSFVWSGPFIEPPKITGDAKDYARYCEASQLVLHSAIVAAVTHLPYQEKSKPRSMRARVAGKLSLLLAKYERLWSTLAPTQEFKLREQWAFEMMAKDHVRLSAIHLEAAIEQSREG